MPHAQIYDDIWLRWIPEVAKNRQIGGWNADVSPNVLVNPKIKKVQYILPDYSCVFIPMADFRIALRQKPIGKNGMIFFVLDPNRRMIDGVRINSLRFFVSRIKRRKEKVRLFDKF